MSYFVCESVLILWRMNAVSVVFTASLRRVHYGVCQVLVCVSGSTADNYTTAVLLIVILGSRYIRSVL